MKLIFGLLFAGCFTELSFSQSLTHRLSGLISGLIRPRNFQRPVQFVPRQPQRHKLHSKPAPSRPSSFGRSGSVFLKKNVRDKWARAPVLKQYNPPPPTPLSTPSTYKPDVTAKPLLHTPSSSPSKSVALSLSSTSSPSSLRHVDKDHIQLFDVAGNHNEIPLTGRLSYKSRDQFKTTELPYQKTTVHDPFKHIHVSENEIIDIDYTFAPKKESTEDLEPLDIYNDIAFEFKEVNPEVSTIYNDEILTTPAHYYQETVSPEHSNNFQANNNHDITTIRFDENLFTTTIQPEDFNEVYSNQETVENRQEEDTRFVEYEDASYQLTPQFKSALIPNSNFESDFFRSMNIQEMVFSIPQQFREYLEEPPEWINKDYW